MRATPYLGLIAFGLGAPAALMAQAVAPALVGRVTDEQGNPLARAAVVVVESGRVVETGADGRFQLRSSPAGELHLRVSLLGYAPVTRAVVIPAAGEPVAVAITLARTPLSLSGLQVTGTAVGRDPMAVTQATTQLGGQALEREMSTTLAETLRNQPGLAVRYNGPAAAAPVVRGLTGDRVLVLQDGQRTADLSGSADDHGVTIDPMVAQRIEVVRGPATLLYGNNALGGVVNVISGDIPTTLTPRASWMAGVQMESAYPGASGNLKAALPLGGNWAMTARAGGKETGDVRIGDDPVLGNRLKNTAARNLNGAAGVGYIGDRAVAGGAFRVYDFRYGLPAPPGADPVDIRGRRYELSGRAELTLASPLFPSLRVEGTAQDYVHDEIDAPSDEVQQTFALKTQTINLLLHQGAHALPTTGAWGVSGLFKDYTATGEAALTPAAASRSVGLFGFQELTFFEGGPTLQLGGRYDIYHIESKPSPTFGAGQGNDYRAFSGSVGLSIPLAEGISLGGSLARSFRAPTVEELYSAAYHAGTGTVELGDSTLRAERGLGMEAVLRVRSGSVNGQVAAYHNAIEHFVYMAALGDTLIGGADVQVIGYTQQRATLAGVEGSLEWAVRRQLVVALMGDMIRATLRDGTPVSFIPPTRLGGEIRWDNGSFSLGGTVHHEFRQDRVGAADELPTDAHTVLRLTAGVRKTVGGITHSIALRGDNLANELHREATSRIKEFAPNPGRNISVVYRVYF